MANVYDANAAREDEKRIADKLEFLKKLTPEKLAAWKQDWIEEQEMWSLPVPEAITLEMMADGLYMPDKN